MRNRYWTASLAALSFAAFSASNAAAQDAGELEEIVVTARKTAENLQDVPIAVTAFSGEQLQEQNALRVSDVARLTPGFTARESNSNPTGLTLAIRGQVQTDILATLDPSVGTYVDGYYWARAYGVNTDLLDVQSVQVLKGPQGTLFGRNTTGGALLFQTNDPNYNGVSGSLQGTYGSFDEMIGTAILNVPIVDDKLAVRAAVQKNTRDGIYHDVAQNRHVGDRDNWSGRFKIRANPVDNFEILLSAEAYEADMTQPVRQAGLVFGAGAIGVAGAQNLADYMNGLTYRGAGTNPDLVASDIVPYTKVKTRTYTGTFTYDTDIATFKYITGYRKISSASAIDLDGTPFPVHVTLGEQELDQTSHELQATGEVGPVKFAAGGFYFTEGGEDRSTSISLPNVNVQTNLFSGVIDNVSKGAYGQLTWQMTEALSITGGLRYSVEEKGLESRNRNLNRLTGLLTCQVPSAIAPECLLSRSDEFEGTSYTAAIDYRVTPDILVYAKTSSGFRGGGQNLRANSQASFVPFEPEEATDYEVGLKSEFFDRRVRLNVAIYQTNVEDIQRSTLTAQPGGGTATILGNAGEMRVRGAEAELEFVATEDLRISATGALTDPKYIEYRDLSGDRSSEPFPGITEESFTLAATWSREMPFGRLTIRGDYAYIGETPLGSFNTPSNPLNGAIIAASTQPAAQLFNARAALRMPDDRWEVAGFVRNITDNRDPVGALFVPAPLGYVSHILREPRTFGVSATYRFGD